VAGGDRGQRRPLDDIGDPEPVQCRIQHHQRLVEGQRTLDFDRQFSAATLELPIQRLACGRHAGIDTVVAHQVLRRFQGAVYSATKFAVRAISEGLRKESGIIRCTCIYPGVVQSELAETITDPDARARMIAYRKTAIGADAIGRAVLYAIEQPAGVDVNEIVVRPTATQV
jgi:NAD(P)-dependent dehydrogenase (short-subunit alcohol dehydrogenase family)